MPEDDPCKIDNGGCGVHTCIADESGTHSCQCNGGYTSNPDRNPPCQGMFLSPLNTSSQTVRHVEASGSFLVTGSYLP